MSNMKMDINQAFPEGLRPSRLSDILLGLLRGESAQLLTVGSLIHALGDRAFPVLLFIFAAINVIPAIPGTSGILGLPLVFLVLQRLFGYPVALPGFLMKAKLPAERFIAVLNWALPRVYRLENIVLPRQSFMFSVPATRLLDILITIIAVSVLIPLPFTAIVPAFAICLIAIGRIEQDGLLVQLGSILGLIAVAVTTLVTTLTMKGLILVMVTPLG